MSEVAGVSETLRTGEVRCAAIIAGGASRRMGRNKALLEFEGQPLVRRIADALQPLFERVIVVTGDAETRAAAGVPFIEDTFASVGPVSGLHAALSWFGQSTFCVACDMPFLNPSFIAWQCCQLGRYEAVVPQGEQWSEPLHAVYRYECLSRFYNAQFETRVPPLQKLVREFNAYWVSEAETRAFDPSLKMFTNWNTPEEVQESSAGTL